MYTCKARMHFLVLYACLFLSTPFQAQVSADSAFEELMSNARTALLNGHSQEAQQAYERALQLDLPTTSRGRCLNNLGVIAMREGRNLAAIRYYRQAMDLYEEAGLDSLAAETYLNATMALKGIGKFEEGLDYAFTAARTFERGGHRVHQAKAYQQIGTIYRRMDQPGEAVRYQEQSLELLRKTNDMRATANALNDLGNTQLNLEDFENAVRTFQEALELKRETSDSTHIGTILYNIALARLALDQPLLARGLLEEALRIQKLQGDSSARMYALNAFGRVHSRLEQYKQAEQLYAQVQAFARQNNDPELLLQNLEYAMEHFATLGKSDTTLAMAEQRLELYQSIIDAKRVQTIEDLRVAYESEQQERENALQKVELEQQESALNTWRWGGLAGLLIFVLVAAVTVILFRRYKERKQHAQETEHLLRELHHRTDNNLQALDGSISVHLRNTSKPETQEVLRELSSQMKATFLLHHMAHSKAATDYKAIPLHQFLPELAFRLGSLFKADKGMFQFDLEPIDLEVNKATYVSLIANELISNALKYGSGDFVRISLKTIGPRLSLEIANTVSESTTIVYGTGSGTQLLEYFTKKLEADLQIEKGSIWKVVLVVGS